MGDEKNKPDHKVDLEHVNQQVGVIDATNAVSEMLNHTFLGGGVRFFGKTDFEGHELNDMVDMVESANPEHLETAGKALWDARDAINDAAEELSGHIGRVDWDGEAGSAFRTWGGNLVTHARDLAGFAEVAGTQITAAATGLASVRKSMPPRDARPAPKTVADIPAPKRIEGNHEYTAAVTAENHRQEAINQMNRLSSFYAVSEETLAAQEPPVFEPMPGVGVPKPDPRSISRGRADRGGGDSSLRTTSESGTVHHTVPETTVGTRHPAEIPHSTGHVDDPVPYPVSYPDRPVGTEIDSVGTLPQDTAHHVAAVPPSATGPGGSPAGNVPVVGTGAVAPPLGGPVGRVPGSGGGNGAKSPLSAQGRVGTSPGGTGRAAGRGPLGQVGRAATTGQPGARGIGSSAGKPPMGRSVTGGIPRTAGTAGGRAGGTPGGRPGGPGATNAGRANGVVGGKPSTGTTPGKPGSRLPRGTVVGGKGAAESPVSEGRLGQRGVIGAPDQAGAVRPGQTPRRSMNNPEGVVGAPKGRTAATKNKGFTSGGTGLVRGPGGGQAPGNARGKGTSRSERPNEDEDETRSRERQRRDVPPTTD
ncbi:WXG100 family type VII secretion target [Streptomyces fagopyri]|uniref:WXG100 family type VII secretion target n=1 Tax=Streptomyces fagopyri TaxID=2662397 RepID=UPI0012938372|nr:hypothetical protein [Streptomyces fagopyri]